MSWVPPDDFYPGYSLYLDFKYGPENEFKLAKVTLSKLEVEATDEIAQLFLHMTRDLLKPIREKCQIEIEERTAFDKREIIVGGFIPPDVELAKSIVIFIMELLKQWGWVIPTGYKLLKTLLDRLRQKKNPSNLEALVVSALEKIGTDEVEKIVLKKAEKITVEVKRTKKAKPRKQTPR